MTQKGTIRSRRDRISTFAPRPRFDPPARCISNSTRRSSSWPVSLPSVFLGYQH